MALGISEKDPHIPHTLNPKPQTVLSILFSIIPKLRGTIGFRVPNGDGHGLYKDNGKENGNCRDSLWGFM